MSKTAYIRPASEGTYAAWTLGAGASKAVAVDPGDPPVNDGDASYVYIARTSTAKQSFLAGGRPTDVWSVTSVNLYAWLQAIDEPDSSATEATFTVRLRGAEADSSPVNGFWSPYPEDYTLVHAAVARPGGGAWCQGDLLDSTLEMAVAITSWTAPDPSVVRCSEIWIQVEYEALPTQLEQVRGIGSRLLRERRESLSIIRVRVPLDVGLDAGLGALRGYEHMLAPQADGEGWGHAPWERRAVWVLSQEVSPADGTVELELLDARRLLAILWDGAWPVKTQSLIGDGISRFSAGCSRTFARPSPAWIEDPVGRRTVKVNENTEKLGYAGMAIEGAATAHGLYSFFVDGLTGWSTSGSGTIATDTSDLLHDTNVSPYAVKLTAGSPISSDLQAQGTATGSLTGKTVRVVLDTKDAAPGVYAHWALQRAVDSYWWDDASGAWVASKTWNACTGNLGEGKTGIYRHASKPIVTGGSATTLTPYFGIPTTGTPGQVNHVYTCEIVEDATVGSRILTQASTADRDSDRLLVSNDAGARCWSVQRGAFVCEAIPWWSSADVSGVNKTLCYVEHAAGTDFEWIYYDGTNGRWVFTRRIGGVDYSATLAATLARGTPYKVAARWVSALGELGLDGYEIDVFAEVGGVWTKGTQPPTQPPGCPAESAAEDLELGSAANGQQWDGLLRSILSVQWVPLDDELPGLI